jgi:ribosomal protein S18 acetylase RimI-like enzyme
MEFIEQLACQRGFTRVWLTVNKGNPSVKVYERLGFRIAKDLVMDIGNGFVMDDYRMEKTVDPSGMAR